MNIFNLEHEKRIIESGVREVFTPYQPIMTYELFFGRQKEVHSIIQQLNTPGQHSVLFGDRGVGKSSLANIACELLKPLKNGQLVKKRCDSSDTFLTIVEKLLIKVDVNLQISSSEQECQDTKKAGVKLVLDAGLESKSTDKVMLKGFTERAVSPSWVAEKIKDIDAIFLLDEIDVIAKEEKWKVAELIKQLSDEGSLLKFLVVGIAETSSELTHGHKSVQRCLKETQLKKLTKDEVRQIITEGAKKLGLEFSNSAIRKIEKVSAGYAHFAHLLCLKSAEAAIGENRNEIGLGHIQAATDDACGDAEGSLRTLYNEAIRSANTEEFKKILIAASSIVEDEFKASRLRGAYEKLWGVEITQGWLNNYLQKVVSEYDDTILRRLAKGVYKFNDPRMPSYIRLANLTILPEID
ncbi:nSTAND1 domain-containing NTPase [Vibrio astriarenae]|uniref:nSTAND1 domain-containing NTPase n=1 Tax=Vibrio astriarenae TaxID=1481923 RepID=UPI003736454F